MNYLFKPVMIVKHSTNPWQVSIKMGSTKICHESSSAWTQRIYGIHACNLCLPSHTKKYIWRKILNQDSPRGSLQTFDFLNNSGNSNRPHGHQRTPHVPSNSMGTHKETLSPLQYLEWKACSILKTSNFKARQTIGIDIILQRGMFILALCLGSILYFSKIDVVLILFIWTTWIVLSKDKLSNVSIVLTT